MAKQKVTAIRGLDQKTKGNVLITGSGAVFDDERYELVVYVEYSVAKPSDGNEIKVVVYDADGDVTASESHPLGGFRGDDVHIFSLTSLVSAPDTVKVFSVTR